MSRRFRKILVANRGEIAVRVIRALREQEIPCVAVYSEADRNALHVRFANEAVEIGPPPSGESYLRQDRILEAARKTGADAVHPGYGFLSENASFVRKCEDAGITFIGPRSGPISLMGDKLRARETAMEAGVPVVPGSEGSVDTVEDAKAAAARIGYPVMLKASAGGGGKGMRVVRSGTELTRAFDLTRGEAGSAFGDDTVYLEKFIEKPRHIEIQVFGDEHGNAVYLGERECSLQRRHQKIVEEAPSPVVDGARRKAMGEAAVALARHVGYTNAGTVELMAEAEGDFYFLEMNTRLQVEHPVTEMVYGVDLVQEQIRVALGEPLSWNQEELVPKGWAMEARIYAEDPYNGFLPSLGTIGALRLGSGPGIRNDMGIYQGFEVPRYYDPMLGKLIAQGTTREQARRRLLGALREMVVGGVRTNIAFLRWVLNRKEFVTGDFDTNFVERVFKGEERRSDAVRERAAIVAAVIAEYEESKRVQGPRDGRGGVNPWKLMGRPGALERGR